jgi:hypothetical protein
LWLPARVLIALMPQHENATFYVCHSAHEHDRIYTENICQYLEQTGLRYGTVEFETPGDRPELSKCLDGGARAILGINSQLDHCWLGEKNFVVAAARKGIPVIHWLLDHPSSRWPDFAHATAANSRFLVVSEFCRQYFERYCLPGARTDCVSCVGPNWRSRLAELAWEGFLAREFRCLIALNLTRISGTLAQARDRLRSLPPGLVEAVEAAIDRARLDLNGPLDHHLAAVLARRGKTLANAEFNFCFQILDDLTQIWRRQRILDIASRFPVLIQTDTVPETLRPGAVAIFSHDPATRAMQATLSRLKSCRAVLSMGYASDRLHERTPNALNAGCALLVEDTPIHRWLFADRRDALLFRYDDDSLAECLDLVCHRPEDAYAIAQGGFALRDHPAVRFRGFENILRIAGP